jgi:hypothetical protein
MLSLVADEALAGRAMVVAPVGDSLVDFPTLVPTLTEEPLF